MLSSTEFTHKIYTIKLPNFSVSLWFMLGFFYSSIYAAGCGLWTVGWTVLLESPIHRLTKPLLNTFLLHVSRVQHRHFKVSLIVYERTFTRAYCVYDMVYEIYQYLQLITFSKVILFCLISKRTCQFAFPCQAMLVGLPGCWWSLSALNSHPASLTCTAAKATQ